MDISNHLDTKMRALACYQSQFVAGRSTAPPTFLDALRDRARYWGWSIGAAAGEPFVSREEIGLRGMAELV
jgi:LmbE family N-acetylglucosaminyl deacetylase